MGDQWGGGEGKERGRKEGEKKERMKVNLAPR